MRILLPAVALLVLAACGGTLWPSVTSKTPSPVGEVLACAKTQVKSMGYFLAWTDRRSGLDARKAVTDNPHRSYLERQRFDVLSIRVSGAGEGRGTELDVEARSFSEHTTDRGPTLRDEYATGRVKADAQTLVEKCGK